VGISGAGDLIYARGTPDSGGSITWDSDQVVRSTGTAAWEVSISTDSSGYPWIAWEDWTGSDAVPMVSGSTTNDGTWATRSGHPFALSDSLTAPFVDLCWTFIGQLDMSGQMIVFFWYEADVYARVWSGSAWDAYEGPIDSPSHDLAQESIAFVTDPDSGKAYVAWDTTSDEIYLAVRDGSWTQEFVTADSASGIALGFDGEDGGLHMLYRRAFGTAEVAHMIRSSSGSWTDNGTVIDHSGDSFEVIPMSLQIAERARNSRFVAIYQTYEPGDTTALDEIYSYVFPAAAPDPSIRGAATIPATSSVSATAQVIHNASASIAAASSTTLAAQAVHNASTTIAATSGGTAAAENTSPGAATIAATSNVSATAMVEHNASATIASTSSVSAVARVDHNASTTIVGTSGGTANGNEVYSAATTIAATSSVTAASQVVHHASTTIGATSTVTAESHTSGIQAGSATIDGLSSVTADTQVLHHAVATISSQSAVTAAGFVERLAAATIASNSGGVADSRVEHNGSATITAGSTVTASGMKEARGSTTIPAAGAVFPTANKDANASTVIPATSTMLAAAITEQQASAIIAALSNVVANGNTIINAAATINAQSNMHAEVEGEPVNGFAILRSWSTVSATVGQNRHASLRIIARGSVTASGTIIQMQAQLNAISAVSATAVVTSAASRQPRRVYPGRSGVRGSRVRGGVK
jgi:hypothetical protein